MRIRDYAVCLVGLVMTLDGPVSASAPSDRSLVRQHYVALLRLEEQFRQCVGPVGVAPRPARLVAHGRELARLRARAGQAGAGAALASVDRDRQRLIEAVDTSCIIGPTESAAAVIDGYERDLRGAERNLADAIARAERAPRPGRALR